MATEGTGRAAQERLTGRPEQPVTAGRCHETVRFGTMITHARWD